MADRVIREWQMKRDGEHFNCKYYDSDLVQVTHSTLGRKTTKAGSSRPEVIARQLARELLPGKP